MRIDVDGNKHGCNDFFPQRKRPYNKDYLRNVTSCSPVEITGRFREMRCLYVRGQGCARRRKHFRKVGKILPNYPGDSTVHIHCEEKLRSNKRNHSSQTCFNVLDNLLFYMFSYVF
jgi:hypothetical protein